MNSIFNSPQLVLLLTGISLVIMGILGNLQSKWVNISLLKYQRIIFVSIGILVMILAVIWTPWIPFASSIQNQTAQSPTPQLLSTTPSPIPPQTISPSLTSIPSQDVKPVRFFDFVQVLIQIVGILTILTAIGGGLIRIYFLVVPVFRSVILNGRRKQLRSKYEKAIDKFDKDTARDILMQNALWKLMSPSEDECRIGIQEITAHGIVTPFKNGFNALADELASRRKSWRLRFSILKSLNDLTDPIRDKLQEE